MKNSGSGPKYAVSPRPRRLEIRLGALGERARVAVVALAVGRLDHVAGDVERRLVGERIDARGIRIGHEQHVRGLDALPAGDRRSVERMAVVELVLRELLRRDLNVLFLAARVSKAKVDELDLLVLERLQYIGGCSHAILLLVRGNDEKDGRKPVRKGTFLQSNEKQKLCHKLTSLARGDGAFSGLRRCLFAPRLGGGTPIRFAVVQHDVAGSAGAP